MEVMDEWHIAMSKAKLLQKLRYWGHYSTTLKGSSLSSSYEEVEHARLEKMARELAMSRARATKRDLRTALTEVELKILINLATLLELAPSVHPVVENDEDDFREICGVCQDEMEKGDPWTACTHSIIRVFGSGSKSIALALYAEALCESYKSIHIAS